MEKFLKMNTLKNKVDIIEMSNEQGPDDRNHHQLLSQNIPFNSLFSLLIWKNLLNLCAREYCREVLLTRHLFQPIEFKDKSVQPRVGLVNDLCLISKKQTELDLILTIVGDICVVNRWMMKMYLSTAIRRMENEEKKTQVD